jgi:hypothetical protein
MPTLRRRLVRLGMWRRKDLVETKMASGFASLPRCMMRLVSAAIIASEVSELGGKRGYQNGVLRT